jgi:antitoxin component YwqK of YwqJK toxin-antitoxin module
MSEEDIACYVCFEYESKNNQYADSPCMCKGSIVIHTKCLKSVIKTSRNCTICKTHYDLRYLPQRDGKELITRRDINGERIEYTINEMGQNHGYFMIRYPDGQTKEIYSYINGVMEGPYIEYYPDGQVKSVCKCRNGHIEGEYNEWDKYGYLVEESQYKNGVKHGKCIRWFQKGYIRVSKEINYVDGDVDDSVSNGSDGEMDEEVDYDE